jgi:hypothetical protein
VRYSSRKLTNGIQSQSLAQSLVRLLLRSDVRDRCPGSYQPPITIEHPSSCQTSVEFAPCLSSTLAVFGRRVTVESLVIAPGIRC